MLPINYFDIDIYKHRESVVRTSHSFKTGADLSGVVIRVLSNFEITELIYCQSLILILQSKKVVFKINCFQSYILIWKSHPNGCSKTEL